MGDIFHVTVEKESLSTDVKTCDNYLLLAVFYLMDLYESSGDDSHYLRALSWLDEGIKISPSTHQMTILLVHLYSSIGV